MANINVVNLGGTKVGEFELADAVFAGEVNDALLWEAVKHYRAALRQGTAATKNRKLDRANLVSVQIDYIHVCHLLLLSPRTMRGSKLVSKISTSLG